MCHGDSGASRTCEVWQKPTRFTATSELPSLQILNNFQARLSTRNNNSITFHEVSLQEQQEVPVCPGKKMTPERTSVCLEDILGSRSDDIISFTRGSCKPGHALKRCMGCVPFFFGAPFCPQGFHVVILASMCLFTAYSCRLLPTERAVAGGVQAAPTGRDSGNFLSVVGACDMQ